MGSQSGASPNFGKHRPPDVIKAELASAAVPLHIWRRSRQCLDLTLEESRLACAPVLGLRKELAVAEAAERLEAQLVAGRTQLATASVAGSVADPQASALARLTGADEGTIRTGIALLLAGLIEVGSALGFTLVSIATARNPQPPSTTRRVAGSSNSAAPQAQARRSTGPQARERRVQTRHAAAGNRGRGSCASCPVASPRDKPSLPLPKSVPGLQVRSHPKLQLSSRADLLIAGFGPGSTWILLAASRHVTRMPISAIGRELRVSSPVRKHASAGISPRASSISVE